MRVLGIITARGGSKGIPRKNIRLLAGKPLLQYTAEAALSAANLARTLLSTDDAEIASIGRSLGLWVPFLRPDELAQDHTPTLPVLLHVVEWLQRNEIVYDAFCLLQPTTPLRTSLHIDEAVRLLCQSDADAVVSVSPVPRHFHPDWQICLDENNQMRLWNGTPMGQIVTRRQNLAPTYFRNGAIYAMRRHTLAEKRSLYGDHCIAYAMPSGQDLNIDTIEDWEHAEIILRRRAHDTAHID